MNDMSRELTLCVYQNTLTNSISSNETEGGRKTEKPRRANIFVNGKKLLNATPNRF